ncbi:MAG: hypothetical protein JXA52_01540 [Planctomycetes bacterium]|nr:hypothetical protein [Planctomycetota bacterium]
MENEEPNDRPQILKPVRWWQVLTKLKINSLYAFLAIVACLFAALWLGGGKNPTGGITWRLIESEWLSAEMPAALMESKEDLNGIHYFTSGDGNNIAVVALLPAPEGSEIRRAIKEGAPRVAEAFLRLFPLEGIGHLDCRLDPERKSYELTGLRRQSPRSINGSVWLVAGMDKVVVVMTSARLASQAEALCERIRKSILIKPAAKKSNLSL